MAASRNRHAVVIPYPLPGHITPSLAVALRLASRAGFSITFVLPEVLLLGEDLFAQARKSGLDVKCAAISSGVPVGTNASGEAWVREFPASVDEVVGNIKRTTLASSWILVADSLCTCIAVIAEKHGMVNVSLWTSSATVFCLNYYLDILVERSSTGWDYTSRVIEKANDPIDFVPGIQSISRKDLPSYVQDPNTLPFFINITFEAFEKVKKADFILCDTVDELEPETLVTLNQKQPTYAIGPLKSFDGISRQILQRLSMHSKSDCTQWLDSKPLGSVLYIAFGTLYQFRKDEVREITHGLLLSKVNFLWVLKIDDDDIFPPGFEEDVKDRGLVVPWCDQSAIFSNPSVGGFLTHCGWNSVLESAWNGVPMICYPTFVDQFTNRKVVIDDWKIGIGLHELTREEIFGKIDFLMHGTKCKELMENAKNVQKAMKHSLENDGSSCTNFDRFLENLELGLNATRSID